MAVTSYASGTQTASIGTEHTLSAPNAAGVYSLVVDTVNMAAGDIMTLRVYQMALTGGTSRVVFAQTFYGAQPTDDAVKVSLPISNELTDANATKFTLKQTFGTGRAFPWKVLKHA